MPVTDGDVADLAVVLAKEGGQLGLFLVDLAGAGVARETLKTLDPTRGVAKLTFTGAAAERLGAAGEGMALAEQVMDRAAVLLAFEQVGGADRGLEMAKDYALERYAFGRPIGSYQAIKHKLADIYVKNELARSNAYYGAWALNTGAAELPIAASAARVAACEAFWFAAKENIQTHGGMGFTWEVDCHLYYRALAAARPGRRRRQGLERTPGHPPRTPQRGLIGGSMPWTSTTPPKKPPTAPRRAPGWRPTRPSARRARTTSDEPSMAQPRPGRPRRPRPATPGSPGPRSGAGGGGQDAVDDLRPGGGQVPVPGNFQIGLGMCVPTVMAAGNEADKQRFVGPAVRGEEIWCQLFSEPSGGSDVAAAAHPRGAATTATTG